MGAPDTLTLSQIQVPSIMWLCIPDTLSVPLRLKLSLLHIIAPAKH